MEEIYWKQFMETGRVEDYLNYRMYQDSGRKIKHCGEKKPEQETKSRIINNKMKIRWT